MGKKQRDCPALGMSIPSARCGAERGVVIACPEECDFNPFARQNYDQLGEIEDRVIERLLRRFVEKRGFPAAERLARTADRHGADLFLAHWEFAKAYHHSRDATGQTLTEQWEASGFAGLNNDEQQVVRWMAATRLCLIEVHRQIDEVTVEVVDLLDPDPQPFLLVDRSLAGAWVRFATLLTWCYATRHFWRIGGAGREVSDVASAPPVQAMTAIVAHLGGPNSLTGAREWMTENIVRVVESLDASVKAARKQMLSALDARSGKARYRWANASARATIENKLRTMPGIEESDLGEEHVRDGWEVHFLVVDRHVVNPAQPELGLSRGISVCPGEPLLGSILVGSFGLMVQGSSGARFAALKHRVEKLAGQAVVFESERVDDLAAQIRDREPADYDATLVPPALMTGRRKLSFATTRVVDAESPATVAADFLQSFYAAFADLPIPALDDRSPRQAAADPTLRPVLLDLMKGHVRLTDRRSQQHNKVFDLDWLLRDLGLEEILFPPPPLRGQAGDAGDAPDGEEAEDPDDPDAGEPKSIFDDEEWNYDPTGVESPAPGRVLSEKDIEERVRTVNLATNADPDADFLWPTFAAWQGVSEVCVQVADVLTQAEFALLVSHVYQVAWLLHPVPPPNARLHPGRLLHYFSLEFDGLLASAHRKSRGFDAGELTGGTPQPDVTKWIVAAMLGIMRELGFSAGDKEGNPLNAKAIFVMMCMLKAAVREFSHWPVK